MLTPPGSASALEALARTAFGSPGIQQTLVNARSATQLVEHKGDIRNDIIKRRCPREERGDEDVT